MGEDSGGPLAEGTGDAPRWRIVEVVPLPAAAPPAPPSATPAPEPDLLPRAGAGQGHVPVAPAASGRQPQGSGAQQLWGELDALLIAPPVGEPLASSGIHQAARADRARRRRRGRRARRIGLAIVLGAGLGTAVWWWASPTPPTSHPQLRPHAGYPALPMRSDLL